MPNSEATVRTRSRPTSSDSRTAGVKLDRPLLGGNASEEIRVHTLGIHGPSSGILERIDTEHYPNGDELAKLDQVKRERSMAESGASIFAGHIALLRCLVDIPGKGRNPLFRQVGARVCLVTCIKRFHRMRDGV